ncbi:hypothetical protein RQP46_007285 [Phenoliferia psychrophenolica]
MATITSLASELLSHIHCLSVENAPPSERQAARHRFVLVGRAFFLALADPTEFHVDGAIQACHFWEKLEQEKKWEDLVASNKPKMTRTESKLLRTTRGTTNIRRLVLIADRDTSDGLGRIFENIILCAKETNLVALDLDLRDMSEPSWTTLAAVEGVLRGLTGLRELSIRTRPDALCQQALLRILLPLQSLEVLEVPYDFLGRPEEYDEDISKLSFPRLHTLRVPLCYYDLHSFGDTLLAAVGHELRTLDLGSTDYYLITTDSVKNLISSVTNVIHLIWFILVGRAFFLALANPTEFHVGGAIQACHFWKKLEQEKKWEVLVASNKPKMTRTELKLLRTTRGISDIRRLVLIANDSSFGGLGRVFERILRRATETNLVALNLILVALDPRTRYRSSELTPPLATLAPLSDVFGGLVGLRWLRIASRSMEPEVLLRILIPLHSLEVLDLPMEFTGLGVSESLRKLSFPHLHTLRFSLGYYHEGSRPFGITLLRAAGTKLQVLDLATSSTSLGIPNPDPSYPKLATASSSYSAR